MDSIYCVYPRSITMGDYDDERPSWREIDKKRDKSRHYDRQDKNQKKDSIEGPKDRWKSGRVKDALNRLFQGEKGTPEHDKLFNKIHSMYGSERFLPTVQKYIEKYGLPDDVSTLLLFLDTSDDEISLRTIEKFKELYGSLSARQKEDVKRKLSIAALTHASDEVRTRAEEISDGFNSP